MTDQTIPADEVREIVEKMHDHANHDNVRGTEEEYVRFFARQIDELLPAPTRPTLADMTEEERGKRVGGQVDVSAEAFGGRAILTGFETVTLMGMEFPRALILTRDCRTFSVPTDEVTPRPDLPRMTWPGEQESVPPNTLAVGSEWDDADALARACEESKRDQIVVLDSTGDAYVWDKEAEWWEGSAPPRFAPYTILHTGREAADATD